MADEAVQFFQVHAYYLGVRARQWRSLQIGWVWGRRSAVYATKVLIAEHRRLPTAPIAIATTIQQFMRDGLAPTFPLVPGTRAMHRF